MFFFFLKGKERRHTPKPFFLLQLKKKNLFSSMDQKNSKAYIKVHKKNFFLLH